MSVLSARVSACLKGVHEVNGPKFFATSSWGGT